MLQTQPQDGGVRGLERLRWQRSMEFQMYQDVAIATGATATLSWMDRVQWNFNLGCRCHPATTLRRRSPRPDYRQLLSTLYSFSTGMQAVNPTGNTGWQSHSVDMSAFAGQTVRYLFREQIPQSGTGPAQIEFDAISLTADGSIVGSTLCRRRPWLAG